MEVAPWNLDAMEPGDLVELAKGLRELAFYADHKAHAIDWRARGDIGAALVHEATCEFSYERLPSWAKW